MIKTSALTFIAASIVGVSSLGAQNIPVREHMLKNGMKVLLVERHNEPTIACGWVAKVGSSNERPGITGLAHLFEHMMFKGTKTIGTRNTSRDLELNDLQDKVQAEIRKEMSFLRDKQRRGEIKNIMDPSVRTPRLQSLLDEFDKLVKEQRELIVKDEIWQLYEAAGTTGLNASTSEDRTFYIVSIPSNKLELWTLLESDRIMNPVFREFYSERNVVLEERRQTLESRPEGLIGEAYNAMTWMASPYHWQVIGWPSDISQVSREQANEFFATYYAPNNITAVLVGDFNTDKAIELIEKYFSRIPANPKGVPEIITEEPLQPAQQRMIAKAETQPSIQITFKTVSTVHKDALTLRALASILSGSSSGGRGGGRGGAPPAGRLGKSLVLEQRVATSVTAFSRGQKLSGTFSFRATPLPGQSPENLESLIYAEIQKIVQNGVTDEELARVKTAAQMSFYLAQESNTVLRGALAEAEAAGSYKDFLQGPARLQAITKEDIQRVAREYLVQERSNVLITTRAGAPAERQRPNQPQEVN
ncbi:MAG: insulinase family protein [Holophagales bacterium]|jgi:predicted Zn-dependent peptidase|nr:insulinase family protein [Holophagales bacterium]